MHARITRSLRLNALALATAMVFTGTASAGGPEKEMGRVHLSGMKSGQAFDRFIVKFSRTANSHGNSAQARLNVLNAAGRGLGLARVQERRELATGAHLVQTERKLSAAEAESFMAEIARGDVEYVQVDGLKQAMLTPNDTNYSQQWGYNDSDAGIRANEAWDVTTGSGVVVAVLDTGITNHSDLNANVLAGYDFIADDFVARDATTGRDSDASDPGDWHNATECDSPGNDVPASNSSWHGTHVAGTVAAVTNNAKGVAGTAHNAKIVPLRVLGRCGGYDSDIADAIIWASGGTVSGVPANANPAEVINLSLGGGGACDPNTQAAINTAVGNGTALAIAAGNDNINVSNASPANCNNVIAVASITSTGARSSFSNYGSLIDITAPGSSIMSTLNSGTTSPSTESYASYNGTSMATPHVAGVIALMQAVATTPKTPAQIETLIKTHYRSFPATPSQTIGAGIIDAKKLVDNVNGTTPPPSTTLTNGVAKTGLGASTGASLNYTLAVPAGATGLKFVTAGGTGDSDMYVKFGSAPTDTSYDCRPYLGGNAETCNIATAQAGTYYVRLKAYTTFSGLSLTGSYTAGGGCSSTSQTYSNTADYTISDNSTVDSPIAISGRCGNAPSSTSVSVNIVHTYQGDLKVDLVAPDGSLYNIHNYTGAGTDNIVKTVTLNLSSEAINGTWKLRVNDNAGGDTGYINSWSVTF